MKLIMLQVLGALLLLFAMLLVFLGLWTEALFPVAAFVWLLAARSFSQSPDRNTGEV